MNEPEQSEESERHLTPWERIIHCIFSAQGTRLSIVTYALAGADSFDGLEWCQTTVDHETGKLLHFQQWDLIRHQTKWGEPSPLPYIQSVLMHNLYFYREFMVRLCEVLHSADARSFLRCYATNEQASLLFQAGKGNN